MNFIFIGVKIVNVFFTPNRTLLQTQIKLTLDHGGNS